MGFKKFIINLTIKIAIRILIGLTWICAGLNRVKQTQRITRFKAALELLIMLLSISTTGINISEMIFPHPFFPSDNGD